MIGRFGGDEFVILLKNVRDEKFVTEKAAAIVKAATGLNFPDKEFKISASVGIAIFSGAEKNYSEICRSDCFQKSQFSAAFHNICTNQIWNAQRRRK